MSSSCVNSVIDSFIHGKQAVLSFRELSALSDIPLREARQHLSTYALKASDITVLYHVSTKARVTLTTTKPSTGRAKVWAIAPKAIKLSTTVWMNGDRESMLKAASEPSHQPNALRDGRYLPIHSTSAAWDTRIDPRFAGQPASSSSFSHNSRKASAVLNAVKMHQKRTSNAVSNAKAKRSKKALSLNGSQRELNDMTNAAKSVSTSSQASQQKPQQPRSLFSSKPLGQAVADRMKGNNNLSSSRKNIRKRRITCDDDDDDQEEENEMKKNAQKAVEEEEEEEDVDSEVEIERRAFERERKDADERAEVEQELQNLSNEVPGEPESPEIKDVDDDGLLEQDLGVKNKERGESVKRSFRETFGLPPEQANGTRRIRKEVEVTVEENGYFVTRREVRTFDEHGNEIKNESPTTKAEINDSDKENKEKSPPTSCMPLMTPKAKRSNDQFKDNDGKGAQPSSVGGSTKTKSQKGGVSKKAKKAKGKGNIASFFSKKS